MHYGEFDDLQTQADFNVELIKALVAVRERFQRQAYFNNKLLTRIRELESKTARLEHQLEDDGK